MLIRVDYDNAYRQADRLMRAVNESERACRQVQYVVNSMHLYWKGEAQKQFEAGLLSWKRQQEKLQDEMKAVSDNIRAVADNLREAENRVKTQIANGGGGGSAFGSGGSSGGR